MQYFNLPSKEIENIKISNGNIELCLESFNKYYIGILTIPSGKFLLRFGYNGTKITKFELLDFSEFMFINVSIVKMLKNLVEAILKKNNIPVIV